MTNVHADKNTRTKMLAAVNLKYNNCSVNLENEDKNNDVIISLANQVKL